jgi:hypothetical protein
VLAANNFNELADLDLLSGFGRLTHLVLMENPISRKDVSRSPLGGEIDGAIHGQLIVNSITVIGLFGGVLPLDFWITKRLKT